LNLFLSDSCSDVRTISDCYILGPFAKFVDSPHYSESELCRGAVTVSLSKYLPWQTMHFLQRSTHFSKTCCRPLITSKFLALELPFHSWKSPEIAWGGGGRSELNSVFSGSVEPHQNIRHTVQISPHAYNNKHPLRSNTKGYGSKTD
jgi:hypothetical protein